jgi:quinol monooxygenase YgiN
MIGVIVEGKVNETKVEELQNIFRELRTQVVANEPGAVLYHLCKNRDDPDHYTILEVYEDQDAVAKHSASEYLRANRRRLTDCFADKITLKLMDVVI